MNFDPSGLNASGISGLLVLVLVFFGFAGYFFLTVHIRAEGERYQHREYKAEEGAGNGHKGKNGHAKDAADPVAPVEPPEGA